MAFSELEIIRVKKAAMAYIQRNRSPAHLRNKVDKGFRFENQCLDIFEFRPQHFKPEEKIEEAVAKAFYVKKTGMWNIYWQRQDLNWHRYDPVPEVKTVDEFLSIVERDKYGCFLG